VGTTFAQVPPVALIAPTLPDVPTLALTAAATVASVKTYPTAGLAQPNIHIASFNRPNLYYEVQPKQKQSYSQLLQLIRAEGSGLSIASVAAE